MKRDTIRILNDRMEEALEEYDLLRNCTRASQRELDKAWNRIRETERLRSEVYDLYRRRA